MKNYDEIVKNFEYEKALDELKSGDFNSSVWDAAWAESKGEIEEAKKIYIKRRASMLFEKRPNTQSIIEENLPISEGRKKIAFYQKISFIAAIIVTTLVIINPNIEIVVGGILGIFAAILIGVFDFSKIEKDHSKDSSKPTRSILNFYTTKFLLFGSGIGLFGALDKGYGIARIGALVGYSIGVAIIFGIIGLVVDLYKHFKS